MARKNGNTRLEKVQSYGTFSTAEYQNVNGTVASATSTALKSEYLYRLKAYSADSWIKIGSALTAVAEEGMLMTQYDELTIEVADGDQVSVIGGIVNITPLK